MRVSGSFLLLLGACALGVLIGWVVTDTWSNSAAEPFLLTATDAQQGRTAFLAHGCALCHVATGEDAFPAPASATRGPEIGAPQAGWTDLAVGRAIVDPSHQVAAEFAVSGDGADGDVQSPMAAYADALTVQELADLVAYIRYLGE